MDAVKFIEERKRLCEMYANCSGCPPPMTTVVDANLTLLWGNGLPHTRARRGRRCFWSSGRRRILEVMVCCKYAPLQFLNHTGMHRAAAAISIADAVTVVKNFGVRR